MFRVFIADVLSVPLLRFLKKQFIVLMTEKGICNGSCLATATVCACVCGAAMSSCFPLATNL